MSSPGNRESEVIIYQILGRLEKYERIQYVVNNETTHITRLSSLALARHYMNKNLDVRIEFLVPLSLLEPMADKSESLDTQAFIREVRMSLDTEGESKAKIGIFPIPAIGTYKYNFEATPQSIAATIFFKMLKDINLLGDEERKTRLILDASTGLNAYIPPLFDATRAIIVLDKILGGLKHHKLTRTEYAVTEPVTGSVQKQSYQIFLIDYDVKAFMSFPYNYSELGRAANIPAYFRLDPQEKEKLASLFEDNRELKEILNQALLAFNAVKYNAPLVLFDEELIELNPEKAVAVINKLTSFFKERLKPIISEGHVKVPELEFRSLVNLFISIFLYIFIARKVREFRIPVHEEGVNIEGLLKFRDMYDLIDMSVNSLILESEILKMKNSQPSSIKRNFFAHAGFSKDTIKINQKNGKIHVQYREERISEIMSWLRDPGS